MSPAPPPADLGHVASSLHLDGLLLPLSKPAHMFPLKSHPSLSLWAPILGVEGGKEEERGKPGYFRAEELLEGLEGGKQGADVELGGSLLGKVLSDSDRQRPGLGTKPNPKSRLQALILVSKLAPEKVLDANLLWTLLQTVPCPNPTPANQTTAIKGAISRSCKLLLYGPVWEGAPASGPYDQTLLKNGSL